MTPIFDKYEAIADLRIEDNLYECKAAIRELVAERDALAAKLSELDQQEPAYLLTPDGKCYAHGSMPPLSAGYADATLLKLYLAAGANPDAKDALKADMFWNAEQLSSCIEEFLNDEICNGSPLEVGHIRTIQRAVRLPNIDIRITSINDGDPQTLGDPCGYALFKPSRNGRTEGATMTAPQEARMTTLQEAAMRQSFETWAKPILGDNPTWKESGECELAWQSWKAALAQDGTLIDEGTKAAPQPAPDCRTCPSLDEDEVCARKRRGMGICINGNQYQPAPALALWRTE